MKANEFVKKFGWKWAKEVVENQPEKDSQVFNPYNARYSSSYTLKKGVSVAWLKRYVESWELVVVWRIEPESWRDAHDGDIFGLDGANERALSILNHKNVMVDKMQAKIDEFKKLRSLDEMAINQLAQANQVWQIKCDELQARIDGALEKCYIGIRKQGGDHYLELVEDILKGNKDEN